MFTLPVADKRKRSQMPPVDVRRKVLKNALLGRSGPTGLVIAEIIRMFKRERV